MIKLLKNWTTFKVVNFSFGIALIILAILTIKTSTYIPILLFLLALIILSTTLIVKNQKHISVFNTLIIYLILSTMHEFRRVNIIYVNTATKGQLDVNLYIKFQSGIINELMDIYFFTWFRNSEMIASFESSRIHFLNCTYPRNLIIINNGCLLKDIDITGSTDFIAIKPINKRLRKVSQKNYEIEWRETKKELDSLLIVQNQ